MIMDRTIANATKRSLLDVERRSLRVVFASTSGHTEYVVEALIGSLRSITPGWEIEETMAEKAQPQDLLNGMFSCSPPRLGIPGASRGN